MTEMGCELWTLLHTNKEKSLIHQEFLDRFKAMGDNAAFYNRYMVLGHQLVDCLWTDRPRGLRAITKRAALITYHVGLLEIAMHRKATQQLDDWMEEILDSYITMVGDLGQQYYLKPPFVTPSVDSDSAALLKARDQVGTPVKKHD